MDTELINEPESDHFSGFIFSKDDNNYLVSSSSNGYINIWDLFNKNLVKVVDTYGFKLANIMEWNGKYIIVAERNNKFLKIINLDKNYSITDMKTEHNDELISIKKIYHPIYGEALLSAGRDKVIKLWTFQ